MDKYRITEVTFSTKTVVVGPRSGDFDHIEEGVPHTRTTSLIGHVSYFYPGFSLDGEYGTVIVDLGDLCEVSFDKDGNAISLTKSEVPTKEEIETKINEEIEKKLKDIEITSFEKSYNESALDTVKEYDFDSRFQTKKSYPELEDWTTGIGAIGYNVLDIN